MRNIVERVTAPDTTEARKEFIRQGEEEEHEARRPKLWPARDRPSEARMVSLPEYLVSRLPTGAMRDSARMLTHGVARTGSMILRTLDLPNRIFGNSRSLLQDIYEKAEENIERDAYEDQSGVARVGETAVHLATAGVFGKALPAVFGANVGADTYETAKYAGASEGEALAKGVGHGVVDTAIWTLGQGLASKYLPKAWQWLGRELTGAMRGAASSVTSDAMLNSLGADISGEEMAKRAVHAAWMVPLLGMLKMGGKRREEAMSLLRKARPELAGAKADKVIETIEAEFSDPKSQKVALAWVARKGANLPDDTAQIRQALEVSSKVKGLDPMSKSPFEILSDPAYARYLPKPKPQDVKAFSNMKRYPMGIIGFDVSDDAAGRQATREMINAYMSPSSNPWCLATGKDAAKLGGLGPGAESYWKQHSAVPKQIFFQEVDGKLELTAFRATSPGAVGQQEYWDTSDAGYSGIPIKVKVPGDPMGRYRKMVFRPASASKTVQGPATYEELDPQRLVSVDGENGTTQMSVGDVLRQYERAQTDINEARGYVMQDELDRMTDQRNRLEDALDRAMGEETREIALRTNDPAAGEGASKSGEVQGTFEDIAPGKVFKGDPFRDGRSQTWAKRPGTRMEMFVDESGNQVTRELPPEYFLVEDKVRTTENGITKFRTTKYADPMDWDYEPPKPGEAPKPVEIEESELVSPEWMRARGYDPENESDVRRMQRELEIQAWGNGMEAAMAVVPTKRTYMQTKSGTPETVTYEPNGNVVSVDFVRDGTPYRLEYLPYRRDEPNTIYGIMRDSGGVSSVPASPESSSFPEGSPYRLLRNPDSPTPEVSDEVRWDEGLGSYVRTSGNRRWRIGVPGQRSEGAREGLELFSRWNDAERSFTDVDSRLVNNLDDTSLNQMYFQALEARNTARQEYRTWASQHPSLIDPDGTPSRPQPRLLTEDRQPDGTWAPAVDRRVNAETGEVVELPPPPSAARTSDTRMGHETPGFVSDDVVEAARSQAEDAMEEAYIRHLQGDLPDNPNPWREEDILLREAPISEEEGHALWPEMQGSEGDIPFALKAGRTRRNVRAAEGGGDAGSGTAVSGTPVPVGPAPASAGPRIVINPQVFGDKRDALCVAFNEAFRIVMEDNGFDPVSEPTERQRRFFADTAYADDENQLRRTILARIATLDTSVEDPTDEQLQETAEMLEMVMEVGAPQNEWEQASVQRLHDVVEAALTRQSKL